MTEEKKEAMITDEESNLAKKTLKIIANSSVRLGDRDMASEHEVYKEMGSKILKLYLKAGLKKDDIELMGALMTQAISIANNVIMNTVTFSENLALEKFWGKHPEEVTLADIDREMEVPERLKRR